MRETFPPRLDTGCTDQTLTGRAIRARGQLACAGGLAVFCSLTQCRSNHHRFGTSSISTVYEHFFLHFWYILGLGLNWHLRIPIRLLRRLACSQILSMDQCCFGCAARKPTMLLLVRLSGMVQRTHGLGAMGRCAHGRDAHPPLKGRNTDGSYKTFIAKIYPPALNAALADSIAEFCCNLMIDGKRVEPLDRDIAAFARHDFVSHDTVQPDHYR